MVIETCACCGAIIPTKKLFGRTKRQELYEFLARHPDCYIDQIMTGLYGNYINGGPDSSNIISVMLMQMRPILEKNGLTIKTRRGPGAVYRLEKLEEVTAQ